MSKKKMPKKSNSSPACNTILVDPLKPGDIKKLQKAFSNFEGILYDVCLKLGLKLGLSTQEMNEKYQDMTEACQELRFMIDSEFPTDEVW
jgi:hypothetical protein